MSAALRSMTGFARVQKTGGRGELTVSLKSLNHRGLDVHFHVPAEFDAQENAMRAAIKRAVARGHVDVRIAYVRAQSNGRAALNEPLLASYVAAFRKAAAEHELPDATPDLNAAFRLTGMFGAAAEDEEADTTSSPVLEAMEEALRELNQFREREGAELAAVIRTHNAAIARNAAQIEEIRGRASILVQQRLTERLNELLANAAFDPQRLAQEAALLADRSDVGEEVARLKIHSRQVGELLDAGGEIGKKLDFLLQEMNREANTILSKTVGIGELGLTITDLALGAKSDIEKIREQALNIE
jgi:uncharacterized protein (TIGR00255 family)